MILEIAAGIVLGGIILFILWAFQKELMPVIANLILLLLGLGALFVIVWIIALLNSSGELFTIAVTLIAIFSLLYLNAFFSRHMRIRNKRLIWLSKEDIELEEKVKEEKENAEYKEIVEFSQIKSFVFSFSNDNQYCYPAHSHKEMFLNESMFSMCLDRFKESVGHFASKSIFPYDCVDLVGDLQKLTAKCEDYLRRGEASAVSFRDNWFNKDKLLEEIGDLTALNDKITKFHNFLADKLPNYFRE